MVKRFTKAPLPFVGQKRKWLVEIEKAVVTMVDDPSTTIVDIFGGSGLVSNTVKRILPLNKVVYNDFDDYTGRLYGAAKTEKVRRAIYEVLRDYSKDQKIIRGGEDEERILAILKENEEGLDIRTLQSWIGFAGKKRHTVDELYKDGFYNRISKNPIVSQEEVQDYLSGLDIVQCDFRELLKQYPTNRLIIADPPYLNSENQAYKGSGWSEKDFQDLMGWMPPPYILFSHDKSGVLDHIPSNAVVYEKKQTINHNTFFIDYMILVKE